MLRLCNKKFHSNRFLNAVQRVFCRVKKHAHHAHKTVLHHVHKRRHHLPSYIHVVMLILIILLYNLITFNKAEDLTIPTDMTSIVIENEPEILPEEVIAEQPPVEITTGEIVTEETLTGETLTGETLTGETLTGETLTGEILTGVELISGDQEYFSGVLAELSGEILYDLSGDVVGEVHVESGGVLPVDLSGESLLPQPLSVIYPIQEIQINASGYIMLDSFDSVVTTGGEAGLTYCSRITYENISSILKAGVWTWREVNDYIFQGDADQLVTQGLEDHTMLEVNSGEIKNIFSGDKGLVYGSLYDVYITFMNFEAKVYHRITVAYTDDPAASDGAGGQRYVLDPLRGTKTTHPQKIVEYLAYYDDEIDVHRYIGQAYSPLVIKRQLTLDQEMAQLLQEASLIAVRTFTGETITGAIEKPEVIFTGEIISGEISEVIVTGEVITGAIQEPEIITTGTIVTEEIPALGGESALQSSGEIVTGEIIIEGYFDRAYDKGMYDDKIVGLQKMLTWMTLYAGPFDGIYANSVIESIYQYQLQKNILTPQDSVLLRGYLGPSTRASINQTYTEYKKFLEQNISTGQISTTGEISTDTGINEIVIPETGQETLNVIGELSGVNVGELFDPLVQLGVFSGLNLGTGIDMLGTGTDLGTGVVCDAGQKRNKKTETCKKESMKKNLKEKGYATGRNSFREISSDTLIGTGDIDMSLFDGELFVPVVMQSSDTLGGGRVEVELPEGMIIQNKQGGKYKNVLRAPKFNDASLYESKINKHIFSAMEVGGNHEIRFKDKNDNPVYATFTMPVPGKEAGDLIGIYYSEDGNSFTYLTTVPVRNIDGQPYVTFMADHFTVVVTVANGGTNVSADKAANSAYGSGWTTLGAITIAEGANSDFAKATNVTLILTAPNNWRFKSGVGIVTRVPTNANISAASIVVAEKTLTITITVGGTNKKDSLVLSGIQVQAITGSLLDTGNILRTSANPGTATIAGITNGVTNFGTLGQIAGSGRNMIITLSGQTFVPITGNTGTGINQYSGVSFVIPKITAIDQFRNIATTYSGAKTLSRTGSVGGIFTTGVSFSAGQSTTTLTTTLNQVKTGVTLKATDGTLTGLSSSAFDVLEIAALSYLPKTFYENTSTYDGTISGTITATLAGTSFSSTVVSSGYVTISNVPSGLTGVFTLSGTNKVIIALSGTATSHTAANSTSGLIITFLTGAFVDKNPSEVLNSTQTGIAVQFYDYTVGEQFRVNGTSVGTRFYDVGPYNTLFTGYGNAATETWSGESVMRVDGIGDYIENSKSVITDYPFTMSVRAKRSRTATTEGIFTFGKNPEATYNDRRGIAFQNSGYPAVIAKGTDGTEQITTAASITPIGERVHIAVVFNSATNRQLYVNGVLVATGTTSPGSLSTGAAQNRRIGAWAGQTTHNFLSGRVDEARLFNTSLDATQVESLYMQKPSYVAPKILYNSTGTLTGLVNDPKMYSVTLTISGTTYTGTIQSGVRSNTVGPLAAGTYDVQLKYMNIYGKTGSIYYTGGLIVSVSSISYSSLIFYENSGANNGSITGNSIATLTGGTFNPTVVSSGYVTISNVPAGLTGVFTLSGTNKVIVALSGNATNHTSANSVNNLIISFLTGAFSGMNPSDVTNSTQTGIAIQFYDDPYVIGGGQLRLDGSLLGAGFDDLTDTHVTTGAGGISNSIRTGEIATETVIGPFNGSTQYVSIGNYTLSNYAIATWIKTDDLDSYHPIVTNGTNELVYLYSDNTITLPNHGSLNSTTTLGLGKRYHVALVQSGGSVSLYIDGKEQASGTTTFNINNLALYAGYNPSYTEYWQGLMDEIHIYSGGITSGQVYSLYMKDPSFTPRSTLIETPDLRGSAPDSQMVMSVEVDRTIYPVTNNQDGTRQVLAAGPFASGVYDVQLNYMNVYGKTGMIYYTGGLTVDPQIHIDYNPDTLTSGNVIATVTGYSELVTITNNGGSPNYTFTGNGSFTFELYNATSGTTARITAIVDWIKNASISYSTDTFHENTGLNNGSIENTIIATIVDDTFSSNIISSGLIQMTNIPAGLTGSYTLSGTTQLIIGLTGNATYHSNDYDVHDAVINFLTGAFTTYTPSEVGGSTKNNITIQFFDGSIGSGKLWLDGSYSGVNFYDLSNTHITTGISMTTTTQSGETVMSFNGTNSYIDVGTYTLTNYTMSSWIYRSNTSTSYQSIIARNGVGTSFEISVYNNLIDVYSNARLQSTFTIGSGQWYHIAVVKDGVGTKLFINGELNNSNTFTGGLTTTALAVGRRGTSQYRTGKLDEVRIYDNALSSTQVKDLYMMQPSYIPTTIYTGTTTLTGLVNDPKMYAVSLLISGTTYTGTLQSGVWSSAVGPLGMGTYDVQLNYMNVYGKTGTLYYTGGLIITTESTGSLTISGPVSFDFGGWDASTEMFSIEKTFSGTNDYFEVIDTLGADTGYYTTISISNMTNGEGDIISSSAMAVKSLTGIVTLLGTDNPRIYSAITGAYQYFSGPPLTFIARDTAANGGVKGTYGLHTIRKIDIPALQDPGNYTGVITYTLY